jgi:3-dehydroquinate synthase
MAQRIHVKAPTSEYDIVIEPGLLARIGQCIEEFGLGGPTVIVTNTTLEPLYGRALANALPNAQQAVIPDGEQYKNVATVVGLYSALVAAGLDRTGTVIALGGGVLGDTAGFAAATYMRGVRLVQIPTTLLAMVDSSVGGKVGVDLPEGKNLVGAFKQPDVVLIDPDVLKTLPERELRCGLAEVIKHGFIADPDLLDIALRQPQDFEELVRRAVQVKVDIVQADPYEHGIRAYLNLGHTFAHAVEAVTHYGWPHGEAVGVGLVAAARLSHRLGLCDEQLARFVEEMVGKVGLPCRLGNLDSEELYAAMATDKKWRAGHSRFVLLKGIGQPAIVNDVPVGDVMAVLQELKN